MTRNEANQAILDFCKAALRVDDAIIEHPKAYYDFHAAIAACMIIIGISTKRALLSDQPPS